MPELIFTTRGAAEALAAQEKLNAAAREGQQELTKQGRAAKDAGEEHVKGAKKGDVAQERLTRSVKETREEYKRNLQEQRRLGRTAEQITKRNETAQERYNRLLGQAREAMQKNVISAETFRRETGRLDEEMETLTGRFRSFETARDDAFGPGAAASLTRFAGSVASVSTAWRAVARVFREANDEFLRGQQLAKQATGGIGMLKQLTGDQAEYDRMVNLSKKFFRAGAAPDLNSAARGVFALASNEFMGESDLFLNLARKGIVQDIESLANALGTQVSAFGRQEVGSAFQIISKGFGAGKISPGTLEGTLSAAARAGDAARNLGLSDEETMSAIAVLARVTGSDDMAGTQLRSFIRSADKTGQFKGMRLADIVKNIRGRNLNAEGLQSLLGRDEAIAGFGTLSQNLALFNETFKLVNESQFSRSTIDSRLSLVETSTDTARLGQSTQAMRDVAEMQRHTAQSLLEARSARLRQQRLEEFDSPGFRALHSVGDWLKQPLHAADRTFSTERSQLQRLGRLHGQGLLSPDESRIFERLLQQSELQTDVLREIATEAGLTGIAE